LEEEMSEPVVTLLAVIVGALLTPVTQGVGYLVQRRFEQADRRRTERRQALVRVQDAIVELTEAEASPGDDERNQRIAAAKRRVRLEAVQVGDDRLWELVNTRKKVDVPKAPGPYGYIPGEPGDQYDDWNGRIRELFMELNG
jgi:hypothetical protein